MSDLTMVSLFDGIGGFPLAFERSGARTVATVEIDPAAAAISARHFPHAHRFNDVMKVTGNDLRAVGFVPDRGIITAGWPCQDLSVAGRREGLAGARSGLWWEVVRILDETHSRWFVGENVPGLLSSNGGRDMGAVIGALGELGYGVAYRVLDAQFFGVPQRRRRVFFVGHLGEPWSAPAEVLFEREGSPGHSAAGNQAGEAAAGAAVGGVGIPCRSTGGVTYPLLSRYHKGADSYVTDPMVIEDGLYTHTQRFQRCRAAANGDTGSTPNQQRAATSSSVVAALTANGVGTCGPDDNQAQAGHLVSIGFHATQEPIHSEELVPCIGSKSIGNGVATGSPTVVRRLTELECERLQGYPDGWTEGQAASARYRQLGNSVAVPCVEWVARRLIAVDGEVS